MLKKIIRATRQRLFNENTQRALSIAIIIFLSSATLFTNQTTACSVFSVLQLNNDQTVRNVIGSRTMDFELATHPTVIKGLAGQSNTADINIGEIGQDKAAIWINQYDYIGVRMALDGHIVDGINTAGVYMGGLYLPGETQYPLYSKTTNKPVLGVLDLVNYVLGTSASVGEAINNLEKVQIISSAINIIPNKFTVVPLHFFIKDKQGNGAVIEFIKGKMQIYQGNDVNALTNSPKYTWQLSHYNRYIRKFHDHNTYYKANHIYENGSGYIGLPGNYTPPARFVRLKTLLHAFPSSYTEKSTEYEATQALDAVIVPIGTNPSPTIWISTFNLAKGTYAVKSLLRLGGDNRFIISPQADAKVYNVYKPKNIVTTAKIAYPDKKSTKTEEAKGPQPGATYRSTII